MSIRFAAYTCVLFAGLNHNVFRIQEDAITMAGTMRAGHFSGDDVLAINRMRYTAEGPWGSMAAWTGTEWSPYRSQVGLSGIILAALQRATGESPERVAVATSAGMALLTAGLLAAFFASIASRIAPLAGHIGTLLASCCPPLLNFAPSLYWTLPASLAPFVFAWLACPQASAGYRRWVAFLAVEAALVCIKGLCGYEYISTVVAAPAAAIVYHRAAAGTAVRGWFLPVIAVGIAGSVGFAAAIGLHALQLHSLTGGSGLAVIRERAAARTSASSDLRGEKVAYPMLAAEWLPGPTRNFTNYFHQPILSSPQSWGRYRFSVSLGAVLAAAAAASILLWRNRGTDPAAAALAPAAAVALLAGTSWQVLAINHMVLHGHLNLIVYCIPFAPLAFAAIGAAVSRLHLGQGLAIGLALAAAGTVAWNLAGRDDRDSEQAKAEERVRAVIRGEVAALPRGEKGPPPFVVLLPVEPSHLPDAAAFSPAYGPSGLAEPPIGVYAWVRLPRERTGRVPMTVVFVRESEIVPARVGYFRLAGFERQMNNQSTLAAFHASIQPGPGKLRLFAVPWDAAQPVVELSVVRGQELYHFRGEAVVVNGLPCESRLQPPHGDT